MKKQRFSSNKFAFSLMEMSIVLLVVSILVFGVTRSGAIAYKSRVAAAQSLTKSSPVNVIPNIIAWYETSLTTSFPPNINFNDTVVSTWLDNSSMNNNASQSTAANQPNYIEDAINGLSVVRFSATPTATPPGNNTAMYMTFDPAKLQGSDYTIFVVEKRMGTTGVGNFLGLGGNTGKNAFGYTASSLRATDNTGSSAYSYTVPTYSTKNMPARIVTFYANNSASSNASYVFVNGTNSTISSGNTITAFGAPAANPSYFAGYIGSDAPTGGAWYTGDIAEIIIFNRALTMEERNNIQYYLSKKYSIPTAISSV